MSKLRLGLAILAGLIALASVGLVVAKQVDSDVLPSSWTAGDRADERNIEVVAAARQAMSTFLNTSYETIDKDVDAMLKLSTGNFKKEFSATRVQYEALSRDGRAVGTGDVKETGITRIDDSEALVSVAVNQKVLNKTMRQAIKKGEKVDPVRVYRFQLTLTKVGDRWLLSNLEVI